MRKIILLFIIIVISIVNISNILASNKIETIIQLQDSREIVWLSSMLMNNNYIEKSKTVDKVKTEENKIKQEEKDKKCNEKYPWTIYRESDDQCICWTIFKEWSPISRQCENKFEYIPTKNEKAKVDKYIKIINDLYKKAPNKIEVLDKKILNILSNLKINTTNYYIFSELKKQIQLLKIKSWKINDWRSIDTNCDLPDIKIGNQIWAWCNSTLWEWQEYTSNDCKDSSWNLLSWCNRLSNFKESDWNTKNWVNNIWWKIYHETIQWSACKNWYKVPSVEEWELLNKSLYSNIIIERLQMPMSGNPGMNRWYRISLATNSETLITIDSNGNYRLSPETYASGRSSYVRCIKTIKTWWKCNIQYWIWKVWSSWECKVISCDSWYTNENNTCKKFRPKICTSRVNSVIIWEGMSDINSNCIMNKCYDSYELQNNKCVYSYLKACQKSYWKFAINTSNNSCKCQDWYQWTSDKKSCVANSTNTSINNNSKTNAINEIYELIKDAADIEGKVQSLKLWNNYSESQRRSIYNTVYRNTYNKWLEFLDKELKWSSINSLTLKELLDLLEKLKSEFKRIARGW
jgi:hypothetical protein